MPLLLILIPALVLLAVGWARGTTKKSVYGPVKGIDADPSDLGIEFEDVPFMTLDYKRLHGWWIPKEDAIGTVICLHGKGGNISSRLSWVEDLRHLPVNLFLFDYRGYGLSRGFPTERGLYRDAHSAFEVVRGYYDNDDHPPVVLFGRSLGASVAVELACDQGARGLIVESGFTDLHKLARLRGWAPWLLKIALRDRFPTQNRISDVSCPVLVAHSPDDDLIPFSMGEALHRASGSQHPLIRTKGNHVDSGFRNSPGYQRAFDQFVLSCLGERS